MAKKKVMTCGEENQYPASCVAYGGESIISGLIHLSMTGYSDISAEMAVISKCHHQ
jgi:hypothetical protein